MKAYENKTQKTSNIFLPHYGIAFFVFFFLRFIAQTVYTRCTRINYKIVPVTNFNEYLHYGAMEINNMYINMGVNNGSEKGTEKTLRLIFFVHDATYMMPRTTHDTFFAAESLPSEDTLLFRVNKSTIISKCITAT